MKVRVSRALLGLLDKRAQVVCARALSCARVRSAASCAWISVFVFMADSISCVCCGGVGVWALGSGEAQRCGYVRYTRDWMRCLGHGWAAAQRWSFPHGFVVRAGSQEGVRDARADGCEPGIHIKRMW